jgi:hypothetical protein
VFSQHWHSTRRPQDRLEGSNTHLKGFVLFLTMGMEVAAILTCSDKHSGQLDVPSDPVRPLQPRPPLHAGRGSPFTPFSSALVPSLGLFHRLVHTVLPTFLLAPESRLTS